jgi:hypothetical protein
VSNGFVAALARRRLRAVLCVQRGTYLEPGMSRCFSLFGLMLFALGLVALSSPKGQTTQPAVSEGPRKTPRTPVIDSPRYHVQFSLN